MKYVIDFERINILTNQSEVDSSVYRPISPNISRSYIKEYMDIYLGGGYRKEGRFIRPTPEGIQDAIDTLVFNRILIDKRDLKIDKIIG